MITKLLKQQKLSLDYFFASLDQQEVRKMLALLLQCKGNIIFTGVGKSGFIAKKLAMTFLSTGTRSFFLSPTDALHGDIALVQPDDIVIFLSKSGETKELLDLLSHLPPIKTIVWTSSQKSRLAKLAHYTVTLPLARELCPFNLAPTTSTSIQMLFGDTVAVALMHQKQFSLKAYAKNHPSGMIGLKALLKVKDLMLVNDALPICHVKQTIFQVLHTLSSKQCGAILAVDNEKKLQGVFTDGDLRRAIETYHKKCLDLPISEVMTQHFKWVQKDLLATEAIAVMEADGKRVTVLPVLTEDKRIDGLLCMHDIIQAGLMPS